MEDPLLNEDPYLIIWKTKPAGIKVRTKKREVFEKTNLPEIKNSSLFEGVFFGAVLE